MKKILILCLLFIPFILKSQNVGISSDSSFTPTKTLDVDGNVKVRSNIYLEDSIIDLDNFKYFLDPSWTSRLNDIQLDTGSQTDPSVWFGNDYNTGIYQPGNGSIGFTVNGTDAMRITSSRNLFLNNNDLTGVRQLHFNTGQLYVNGDPGSANQVLKSDGTNISWSDIGNSFTSSYGSNSFQVTTSITTFTIIPGLTTTINVPSDCFVMISTDGSFNTNSTSQTGYSTLDFAIFVDGSDLPNGAHSRVTASNPGGISSVTSTGNQWSLSTFQFLSAGTHTIDVRTVYISGVSANVSSSSAASRQGSLNVLIIRN